MQRREHIESKQQGLPLTTDYNMLLTLIERKGKLSAVLVCNAMPITVGEGFYNLRLITLFDRTCWLSIYRKSVTSISVSIWYSLISFNSSSICRVHCMYKMGYKRVSLSRISNYSRGDVFMRC